MPALGFFALGVGTFGLVTALFNPRQQMTLTPQSLSHSRLRPAEVTWEDLADVTEKKFLFASMVTLVLRDSREFRPSSLLTRWRRVDKFTFNPYNFGVDPDVLRRGIEVRRNVFTF